MKVATWNVNSIRTRLSQVTDWLTANPVDVLCLQETKVVDADFPVQAFTDLGYHLEIYGQKAYNGVAIASREPVTILSRGFCPILEASQVGDLDDQKRILAVASGQICIVNLYVPNGSAVGSEKYDYKLRWLALMKTYLQTLLEQYDQLNVCGDFNIALEDRDIHEPDGKDTHIMASPAEREALKILLSLGLADAFRKFTEDGGHYSWWDYRAGSFRRNRGWRIDHHYLSPALYQQAKSCTIDVAPRKLDKPSDHAPVIVEY